MRITYYPTHVRMGAWIVGILFGYFMHNIRGRRVVMPKVRLSSLIFAQRIRYHNILLVPQKIVWLGWIVSLSMVFAVVFGNYPLQQIDDKTPALIGGLYHSISRITWSMALSFMIYACHFGYGGPINWFLSLPGWQPFSRLTYAIYLLHMPMMMIVGGQSRTSHYFSELNAVSTRVTC